MSTEEPQAVVAAAPEESAADSSTGNNSNSSTAEAVAAAAAAAAAAAQLAAASSSPEVAFPGQLFPTLFVVDFSFVKAGNITEVVEISWIVFDVATRQSLEEVSVLVRPELLLAPADLLSSLGVTQEQLFTASPLGEAIQKLDTAIFQRSQDGANPATLCVYGVEKLKEFRTCASSRQVTLYPHFAEVVVLKRVIEQFMNIKGDDLRSLGTAAGALHLAAPEGREEGLAACRCMCAILFLLLSKGLVLLKEHSVNVEDPPRQTTKPLPTPASNGIPGVGTHIRLRGLPWDVNEDAIIRFVKPVVEIRESDVCVCVGLNKRVTGEAYVNVHTTEMRDMAVRMLHGRMMGARWIEVFRSSAEDFERAQQRRVAMLSSDSRDGRDADVKVLNLTVLKLRGLPWTCTEMNVVNFFQEHGFEIGLDSVVLGVAVDGRMNGIAYVELPDAATADAAKEKLHRKYLGRRFVEVYPSTREEMHRAKRPGRIIPPDARMMGATAQGPYSGGYAPAPQPYGTMATGMGSAQGYGGMDAMGAPQGGYGGYGAPSDIYGGYGGATQQAAYTQPPAQVVQSPPVQDVAPIPVGWNYTVLRLRGMPFNANEQHIVQFFQGFHMTAILPSTIPIDGRPSGEAYVQFSDVSETWRALQAKNGARMDRRYIELFPASKQEMTFAAQGGDPRENETERFSSQHPIVPVLGSAKSVGFAAAGSCCKW
ncbi:RRM domain-containing protein, putative [Eimeria tenella]|uniref:RRM domain-containing protein, putative n=1 Tax=Eimeria tenella TaxID=5802 RepID=U6KUW0_EIMTE|nr:RRM domain-containing protein, putative [Eimeria tenella]CDJ40144.1 RRM domain-containing protein, putative [Eimeria tenella]|eukprot:XP_013230897.1 RRM domain-containing protein, putative [Eimeria tenella]